MHCEQIFAPTNELRRVSDTNLTILVRCVDMLANHLKYSGGIAQLGEHLPCTQGVASSNLVTSTTKPIQGTILLKVGKNF